MTDVDKKKTMRSMGIEYHVPHGARVCSEKKPLQLEFGETLPELEIAYETWGRLNSERDNAVLICPAFSATSHARSHEGDRQPGWWEDMIGPRMALNTDRLFVVCQSLLGSCYGTTGPVSTNPKTGKSYGGEFPIITIRDIVSAQVRLLDFLGIERLMAVIGGSMGGMEALELAVRYPERVDKVIALSATVKTRAFTAMLRHIGRRAIMLDPTYRGGNYEQETPEQGLKLAREIGTIFYRSREEFNERFSTTLLQDVDRPRLGGINFDFQSYLDHQATKIVSQFDANSYLRLSMAMDLHDISVDFPSPREAIAATRASYFILGVDEDRLIPIDEQKELLKVIRDAGRPATWHRISSPVGHDAFLKEFEILTPLITDFLQEGS